LLSKVAEDMLALCDAATISEVHGLGIAKARKPGRMSWAWRTHNAARGLPSLNL